MASSVATPLERRFGRIAGVTEITSTSTLGSTTITLQFDLDRDVDAAARDVQAAIAAAGGELPPNLPLKPDVPQGEPGRRADPDPVAHERHAPARRRSSTRRTRSSRRRSRRCRASGRCSSAAASSRRCACRSIPAALAGVGLSLEDVRSGARGDDGRPAEGRARRRDRSRRRSARTISSSARDGYRSLVVAHNGRRDRAPRRRRARLRRRREQPRRRVGRTATRAVLVIVRQQPGANIIETNERVQALLPQLATSISPAIKMRGRARPHADDPRLGRGRREHARSSAWSSSSSSSSSFLRSGRATLDPERRRAALARRHVRRRCTCSTTASTTCR